jgi:hypothetical protein
MIVKLDYDELVAAVREYVENHTLGVQASGDDSDVTWEMDPGEDDGDDDIVTGVSVRVHVKAQPAPKEPVTA